MTPAMGTASTAAYLHAWQGISATTPEESGAVVEMRIDGQRLFALFELDQREHERRRREHLGAVASTGLLHALWELPEGQPVPWHALQPRDVATLRLGASGHVEDSVGYAIRRYQPPGSVHLLAVVDSQLKRAVSRVGGQAAAFLRLAIWSGYVGNPSHSVEDLQLATRYGLGVVAVGGAEPEVLVRPRCADVGVPSVFRWWLTELAYRNSGYAN